MESKTKEKAIKYLKGLGNYECQLYDEDEIKEAIDLTLQEQAKEIKKGMESYWENHGIEWSWSDWDKFWEKYTGKEEGK